MQPCEALLSIFDDINRRAEANKANHQQRMSDLTRAHFDAHPEQREGIDPYEREQSDWWNNAALWRGWNEATFLYVYSDHNGDSLDDTDEEWVFKRHEARDNRAHGGKRMVLHRPTEYEALMWLARAAKLISYETAESLLTSITRAALETIYANKREKYHTMPLHWVHEQRGLILDFVPTDDKKLPLMPVLKKRAAQADAA